MKKIYIILSILAILFTSCKKEVKSEIKNIKIEDTTTTKTALKIENAVKKGEIAKIDEAPTTNWFKTMVPRKEHRIMQKEIGTWNCEVIIWNGKDKKPTKSTSVCEIKMILGGRYKEMTFKGNINNKSYEVRSILAFNNASKEYILSRIDNLATDMTIYKGTYDTITRTLNLKGETMNPLQRKFVPCRETMTMINPNKQLVEMFLTINGKEYKNMKMIMTRKM